MTAVGYLRGDRAEVIVCRGSALSYPRHNHVSTLTVGLVLEGAVELATAPELPCSLEDMAALACMSKYHLVRAFRREAGLTPHQFQLQNRVRKGQRLLNGPATVAEAAAAAGFCDQSHFDRQFKRLVGLTPADYKRACRTVPGL